MNHVGHRMTVMKGLQHILHVGVEIFSHHLRDGALVLPGGDEVDFVLSWVVYNFVQPDDVRMLQSFQDFQLFEDTVVSIFALSCFFLFENCFVHFFERILYLCVFVGTEIYYSKATFAEDFFNYILINLFLTKFELAR